MLSTHLVDSLATLITEERIEARRFNATIRDQRVKEMAQRRLRREIERLLKADGSVQSVLDVLETVAVKSNVQTGREAKTACCS